MRQYYSVFLSQLMRPYSREGSYRRYPSSYATGGSGHCALASVWPLGFPSRSVPVARVFTFHTKNATVRSHDTSAMSREMRISTSTTAPTGHSANKRQLRTEGHTACSDCISPRAASQRRLAAPLLAPPRAPQTSSVHGANRDRRWVSAAVQADPCSWRERRTDRSSHRSPGIGRHALSQSGAFFLRRFCSFWKAAQPGFISLRHQKSKSGR